MTSSYNSPINNENQWLLENFQTLLLQNSNQLLSDHYSK